MHQPRALREALLNAADTRTRFLWGPSGSVCLADLCRGSRLNGSLTNLAGRSVLLTTRDQLVTALALIELDGAVRRLTLCPPDLSSEHLAAIAQITEADVLVSDSLQPDGKNWVQIKYAPDCVVPVAAPPDAYRTEWILLTSGTTGLPKPVLHSLASLSAAIEHGRGPESPVIWGTYYNICRYGGLQILLRTILDGASLVLSDLDEPLSDYLSRLARHGVTHLLGTPTHWRRALMSPSARDIAPRYVRLSGEIADQSILDALRRAYPDAVIAHAYASTEAGVGFAVDDGFEGFPARFLDEAGGEVKLKVERGSLHIRSRGTASGYLPAGALRDAQNFVDTGDAVELRNGRYYFLGRVSGVINVGGQKVHPEEVEAVINRHPSVEMSCVWPKKNPIMGSIVVADVVLKTPDQQQNAIDAAPVLKSEIVKTCAAELARHKVPAIINIVPELAFGANGKLLRHRNS